MYVEFVYLIYVVSFFISLLLVGFDKYNDFGGKVADFNIPL